LLCAGDDRTDEEMMDAINGRWRSRSITCWVGSKNAHAGYWIASNVAFLQELERLAEVWREVRGRRRTATRLEAGRVTQREA
jgi:trehalose-6-phosphatase